MRVNHSVSYKGNYQGAITLGRWLEDKHVHVELPRKDRRRLEQAQWRLEEWQALLEQAELLERQDREQRELLQQLDHEPPEMRAWHVPELRELDQRHNREREALGLPPRVWWAAETRDPEPAPLVSLRRMFTEDLDQVGIRLRCTGPPMAIAETVDEFREVALGCEVEVQGEPHTTSAAPLLSLRRIFGAGPGRVSVSHRSTGAAVAIARKVKKFRRAAPDSEAEVQGERHTVNDGSPSPARPHSTLAPPVPPASGVCVGTTRAGDRCKLHAGPDGLCRFHRSREPQPSAHDESEEAGVALVQFHVPHDGAAHAVMLGGEPEDVTAGHAHAEDEGLGVTFWAEPGGQPRLFQVFAWPDALPTRGARLIAEAKQGEGPGLFLYEMPG